MTPEEYEAKLAAVRDHYKPQIDAEFVRQQTAVRRAAELAAAQQKVEQELFVYFSAFEAKVKAETIIQMGEPSLPAVINPGVAE